MTATTADPLVLALVGLLMKATLVIGLVRGRPRLPRHAGCRPPDVTSSRRSRS